MTKQTPSVPAGKDSQPGVGAKQQHGPKSFGVRAELPTQWVDHFKVAVRSDAPIVHMSFFADIPGMADETVEVARVISTRDRFCKLLDILARVLDHYPVANEPKPN